MSEELVSVATPAQQTAAAVLGWTPPERYKGDPNLYIDAEEFIKRGETVLPIVKKQLEKTRGELAQQQRVNAEVSAALVAAQTAIEDLKEHNTVATQRAVENARKELKAQLVAASEAGDHIGVSELTDQLIKLPTAAPAEEKKEAPAPAAWKPDVALTSWMEANPWWGVDKKKTGLALGIAQELREKGNTQVGTDFYELVSEEVGKVLAPPAADEPADKVAGARNSGGSGSRGGGRQSFAALPADAKAQCIAESREFVGANKRYKTNEEWQAQFAKLYFAME